MIRYIKTVLKHPKMIKNLVYKNHLGIIVSYDMSRGKLRKSSELINYYVKKSQDIDEIFNFYECMNRTSVTKPSIAKWISNDFECFLIYEDETVIGATWIFKNEFEIKQLSGRTLSKIRKLSSMKMQYINVIQ